MTICIVSTKEELESAKNAGVDEIHVVGDLAENLKKTKSLAYIGVGAVAALTLAIAATPFKEGFSFKEVVSFASGVAPVEALTGIEIATIVLVASIGLALIIAVFTGYEEIDYSKEGGMRLRKKKSA